MQSLKLFVIALLTISSFTVTGQSKAKKAKPEKAFTVYEKGPYMTRVEVRKDTRGTENIIQINAINESGGVALVSGPTLPGAEITGISLTSGSYNMTRQISKTGRGMSLQLLDVAFPVRFRATISGQVLDVEIKQPGFWKVSVNLTQ